MIKQASIAVALVAAIGLTYWQTYRLGSHAGKSSVYAEWAVETEQREATINKLQGKFDLLQLQHRAKEEELTHELALSNARLENELSRIGSEYAGRLQQSDKRADVYQRQARGSALEQERLARHAAELDRSLEEGRGLVRELGETLRQREVTIRALGGIILNDRTLLE